MKRKKSLKEEADQIVSINLRERISPNSLKTFIEVCQRCLYDEQKNRPTMSQVVSQLELDSEQSLETATTISDDSSARTVQPTVFSTVVQNFSVPPNEQTKSDVVIAQLPVKENESPSLPEFDLGTSTPAISESCSTSGLCKRFSLEEIKTATRNFDKNSIISTRRFNTVYKGFIEDGATTVAINRLTHTRDAREFLDKIDMVSKLRHPHVVSPIGYCDGDGEMLLVYDYMPCDSLGDHIFITKKNPPLTWKQRLQICISAGRGLHYLNTHGNEYTNMCGVISSRNILLDEKWVAKVFIEPCGIQEVKDKVFLFGFLLFQVLFTMPGNPPYYTRWAEPWRIETLEQYIDPNLYSQIAPKCFSKFVKTTVACLNKIVSKRPAMSDVLQSLDLAMQLQEAAEQSGIT
ncbi:hypothetical protein ABFS83_06G128300 [Erythranthe nasuta]